MSRPYRICVICTGNICRSPMAEVVLRDQIAEAGLADAVTVDSAGMDGWHVGKPMDPRAQATLRERGYDGAGHRARQFASSWFTGVDLLLAADSGHARQLHARRPAGAEAQVSLLRSFDPAAGADLDVADPYYDDTFDQRLDEIEAACDGVVKHLREHLSR